MTWRFDWITNWDEIWSEPFLARWNAWMRDSPTSHVFFHPTLVRVWVETYMPLRRMEPRFLVAKKDSCTAFLPMVLWRRNWKNAFQRLLIPVGYSDYDYQDPIFVGDTGDDVRQGFWKELPLAICRDLGYDYDTMELTGIRESVACSEGFVMQGDLCPWCDLSGFSDGESFLQSLSKSLRGDIRRQECRMSEMGEISYHVFHAGDISTANETLDSFLRAHTSRWPQAYKPPGFHSRLIRLGLPAGVVHFSFLKVGANVVAWHLGFVHALRFYYYMPAHKTEYAKVSPGKILLYYCVRDAIQSRLKVFDHLRGEENYKTGWTNRSERLHRLLCPNTKFASRLRNFCVDRLKPSLA
jgi:CelD/BcsL family acetyltransferase involved in cellulose biosynthesis